MSLSPQYQVMAPPASLFAESVGGQSPVVLLGTLRRAILQEQRLLAVQVASAALDVTDLAKAAGELLEQPRYPVSAWWNNSAMGAWIESAIVALDPSAPLHVREALGRSLGSGAANLPVILSERAGTIATEFGEDQHARQVENRGAIFGASGLAANVDLPTVGLHPRFTITEADRLRVPLQTAESLVVDCLPWLEQDRLNVAIRIVPVPMVNDRLLSWTNSHLLGAIFVTVHEEPALIAEQMVHELSHTRLFLLQMIDDLIDEAYPNESWIEAKYYSPWRRDPRPLNGILHGAFVFDAIAEFWARILANTDTPADRRRIARRRLGQVIGQLDRAHFTLQRHGRFTPAGEAVLRRLGERLKINWLPTYKNLALGDDRAMDLDAIRGGATQLTVAETLDAHKCRWEAENEHAIG